MTPPGGMPRRAWRVTALVAMVALFALALQRMDLTRAWAELGTIRAAWIGAALLCYVAILPLWATQWHLLAPPAPSLTRRRMLEVVAMTSSVLNTTPMFVGEATGVLLLATRAGIGRGAALSVLAMDQLLVGLAKLVVLSSVALTVALPTWMTSALISLLVAVAALLIALAVASWRHADVARLTDRMLPRRFRGRLTAFGPALAPLRSPARGGGALLLALAKKAAEVLAILCVQRAFGLSLPLSSAVLVLATLNVATLLPLTPANVGIYEAATIVAYQWLGVSAEQALGIAVVQHLCFFVALALPGYWWLAGAKRLTPTI
ncbi:MAG: lysylphosphatidylglycerol synthase transmembrane domain-containing protein [Gemmatimonadaceae bacterium]